MVSRNTMYWIAVDFPGKNARYDLARRMHRDGLVVEFLKVANVYRSNERVTALNRAMDRIEARRVIPSVESVIKELSK